MINTKIIRNTIFASILTIITTCSTLGVTAHAADISCSGSYESVLEQLDEEPETEEEKDEVEAFLKKLTGKAAEVGFDLLGDAIPGGKFLSEPLKMIFGELIGEEDGAEAAIKKLAETQKKQYEDLKNRIEYLNRDLNKYTKALENKIVNESDRETLGDMFRTLSVNLKDLSTKIKNIMNNDKYTPAQKLVLMADINTGSGSVNYLVNVRHAADKISTTISNNGTKLDIDLYGSLLAMCSEKYMFVGEAHKEAMISASALTEQYMYANNLVLQCQAAASVLRLSPDMEEKIGTDPAVIAAYKRCQTILDQPFERDKFFETIDRIDSCAAGFQAFSAKQAKGNRYINKGTVNELAFTLDGVAVIGSNAAIFEKLYKNQYFDKKGISDLVDYIKETTGGKCSIATFLRNNCQKVPSECYGQHMENVEHRYLIVDPTIKETKTEIGHEWYSDFRNNHKAPVYRVTQTIKVIDIYDPECKVQEILVREWENVHWTHPTKSGDRNFKDYTNHFFTITAHAATEADNIKPVEYKITESGLMIRGPQPSNIFSDYGLNINANSIDDIKGPKIG